MKLNIVNSKKNELLGRTEIMATMTFEAATPNRAAVKKAIATAAKVKADLTVVKKIASGYGSKTATVTAYAYSDKAMFEKVEREYMRTRNAKEEPAAPVEEAKEEAPAEEAKEKSEDAEKKEEGE